MKKLLKKLLITYLCVCSSNLLFAQDNQSLSEVDFESCAYLGDKEQQDICRSIYDHFVNSDLNKIKGMFAYGLFLANFKPSSNSDKFSIRNYSDLENYMVRHPDGMSEEGKLGKCILMSDISQYYPNFWKERTQIAYERDRIPILTSFYSLIGKYRTLKIKKTEWWAYLDSEGSGYHVRIFVSEDSAASISEFIKLGECD